MTQKRFKEIVKRQLDDLKKQEEKGNNFGIYYIIGGIIAQMRINKLTLNADQFDLIINAIIEDRPLLLELMF